ncbi:hypothetical protein HAX54_031050, partial [Datura stramonium]|nr:hypothetical protein [Datura stramonium]
MSGRNDPEAICTGPCVADPYPSQGAASRGLIPNSTTPHIYVSNLEGTSYRSTRILLSYIAKEVLYDQHVVECRAAKSYAYVELRRSKAASLHWNHRCK